MNFKGLWLSLVLSIIIHSPCHIGSRRGFIPCSAFELSASLLPVWTAPLLKEEWHFHPLALVTNIYSPAGIHWSRLRSGFSPYNDLVYASEIEAVYRSEKWLKRYKFYFCPKFTKMINSERILLIFNTDPHPNIEIPGKLRI